MKKGVKVFGLIAVLIAIGSLFVGIVSTEVIVADVNKDIAATNVNVTPSSPKDDLELVRGDYETDTSTKNKTERIKVTPIPISKPTLKPRPTPRPKPTSTHDMVVTNVNTTPSSPDLEQPTVIYVTVTNEGKQQEDNVSVKVYVDSAQIGTTQYISLAPGSSNTTTFLWSPTTAKAYSVKGEVEIVNGEIDVKDNTKSIKVKVSAVPTPMPGTPSNPSPSSHTTDVYINTNLDWSDCSNTDFYDVYFGTYTHPPYYGNAPTSNYPFQNDLEYGTKYYWKIEAKSNGGGNTSGPIWDFNTEEAPNQQPTAIVDSITPDPAEQGTNTVSFRGHGADTDGTVEAYNWSSSVDGPLSTSAAFTKPASELSVGTHAIYFKVQDNDGTWSSEDTADLTIYPGPELSYSPESHDFGDMREGKTDNTTFEIWNSGTDTLTYSLSETCDWLDVNPTSGSSTGEHNSITVDMDTTGLFEGTHTCDITINSNDGSGTFTVMVNVVPCPCGNKGVNPTSWSPTLNCGESDSQIVTVSASDCIVNGVTVSKVSGPTWLSVSQTDLGDIASGSSETFTVTAAPPAGTSSGDYPYTIRVSNTCGSPSSRDVAGTINVKENADGETEYWAVIVGVADYTGTSYDLEYTDDDAIDMYNTLLLSGDYWQPDHIKLLLDSEADRAGILTAFDWLDDNEDPDDVVLFFFSGHGTYDVDDDGDEFDGWDEFFCPYDFNNIRDDELDAELDRLGSTSIAVIMDTCFAGGMTKAPDRSVKTLPKQKVELTDGFAKDIQDEKKDMGDAGRVVLMACDDDEYSYEIYELENGLFSYYVIEGLERSADAEGNGDNICSAEETFVYAEPRVVDIISTQNPQLYDGYIGELPITRPPCPELSYSPTSHDFGDKCEGVTDSTTFELWNSGIETLTYSLSESCGWVEVNPTSGSSTGEHDTITVDIDTTGLSEGSHTCDISISSNGGSGTFTVTVNVVPCEEPVLAYSPAPYDFGDKCEGETDSTTFELWNSGTGTLTYSLSESCDWLEVNPTSGSSTGEHDTITVDIDTTGLSEGTHTYDITINSNDGTGTFTVTVNVVPCPEPLWTFMVYLDGDNNLESAAIGDFMEMSSVGSTSAVNIVVQFDRIPGYASSYGDWRDCKRFHVTSGMTPTAANATEDLGECNMGDPNTLSDFVEWAMTEFPADNYALILWNHGDGWKSINEWVPWAADIKDAKDAGLTRGICWDITNNDYLSLQETEQALTGKYVQLLGYDACLMHMVEVVYQVMANAGVSVGSEEVEPGDGWPYDTILADLTGTPTMNEDALATIIVDRYMASYPTYNDLTQSAMDNSALPNLVAAVDNLAQVLINEINAGHGADVQEARNAAAEIYYNYYIDLYHFAEMVDTYVPGAAAQAQTVMNEVSGSMYEAHGTSVPNDHGLSIYFPRVEGDYLASYDNTAFAIDTQWDEFLKRYYEGPDVCEGTATSCGIYPNCENCNEDDGCYVYGNGCEERNYYCKSNEEGCDYTLSNRHTDYYGDWVYYCSGDTVRKHRMFHDYYCDGGSCTDHTSWVDDQLVENCNDYDGWVDTGNTRWVDDPVNECKEEEQKEQEYRDYACSGGSCTYSVTNTQWLDTGTTRNKDDGTDCGADYYDDWVNYCNGGEVWKHRQFHDFYCDGGTCTDHTSWADDQLVENCNDYDGWVDTSNTRWVDDPVNECKEEEQKEQEYHDYTCSDGTCTYSVTDTQWLDTGNTQNKPDGTICGCTASNTLKKCNDGVCTDTGICDATTCDADAACDGKEPGDSCGGGICDSNCKCGVPPVGEDIAVYIGRTFYISTNLGASGEKGVDLWYNFGLDGAKPLVGDFNRDGYDDIAVYIDRTFYISTNLGASGEKGVDLWYNFGVDGAKPLVGDFNRDGYDDIAVYIDRTFYISTNLGTSGEKGVDLWYNFGLDGAKPLVGDFDRDGYDDIAVYIDRTFYISTNLGASGEKGVDLWYNFGVDGAKPLVGDFNRDGHDDIAVYIDRTFYISTNLGTSGEKGVDLWYNFGVDGAKPLVGDIG